MKKVLVTGAAGFIGYHLCQQLIALDYTVVGLDNLNDYYDVDLKLSRLEQLGIDRTLAVHYNTIVRSSVFHSRMIFYKLELEDDESLIQLFKEEAFDLVVHLAAQAGVRYSIENPKLYVNSNINGFLNILDCCKVFKISRLLYASSSSVYGNIKSTPFKETENVDSPVSMYAATKKANELMASVYRQLHGLDLIGLRFFTVYGPWGRPDMAIYLFTDAITNGRPIHVFNNGNLSRDFTYIDDIINGVVQTLESSSLKNHIYNIGNGRPVPLMDFISSIEYATGKKAVLNYKEMQPGDVFTTYADTSSLKKDVSFESTTSIEHGIHKFVEWYNKYHF